MSDKKVNEMWDRKNIPQKVKLDMQEAKDELRNKPEVKAAVEELKKEGYSKSEIEQFLEKALDKAADSFVNKLLSAIQGEKALEDEKAKQELVKQEEQPKKKGLFS